MLHQFEREDEGYHQQQAAEEHDLRQRLNREHEDAKAAARAEASRPSPSGGRPPRRMLSDDDLTNTRVAAISKLKAVHSEVNRKRAEKHREALEKSRKADPTPGRHIPQTEPKEHEGEIFNLWDNLSAAERGAVRSVYQDAALKHDAADEHVNELSRSQSGARYLQKGQRMADDAIHRSELEHRDIARATQRRIDDLVAGFNRDKERGAKPTTRALDLDHCAKTERVRGLLCRRHNLLLGLGHDDPKVLAAAILYLTSATVSNVTLTLKPTKNAS
jgi:hypothetical protein